MLTENEIEEMSNDVAEVYATAEIKLISDIAKRVQKAGKFSDDINAEVAKLEQKGYSKDKIRRLVSSYLNNDAEYKKFIAENTNEYKKYMKKVLLTMIAGSKIAGKNTINKASKETFKNDLKKWADLGLKEPTGKKVEELAKNTVKNATKEISALNKNLCFRLTNNKIPIGSAFKHNVDIAMRGLIDGKETKNSALSRCIKEMSKSGMRGRVTATDGRSVEVVAYARQTLATNLNRLCGDISNENMKETGVEYVEVDTTACPRPSHALWEGKVYSYDVFVDVCGYGDETDADNIYSYNCYHHHYPLKFKSQAVKYHKPSKNVSYNGETISRYDASQVMRKTEREVRALSREYAVNEKLGLPNTEVQALVKEKKNFYRDFAKQTDIVKKEHRFNIYE